MKTLLIILTIIVAVAGGVGIVYFLVQNMINDSAEEQTETMLSDIENSDASSEDIEKTRDNLALLAHVSSLRIQLELYFVGGSDRYPTSLAEIDMRTVVEIDEPERVRYQQTKNGTGYMLDVTLYNGEKLQITESDKADLYQ